MNPTPPEVCHGIANQSRTGAVRLATERPCHSSKPAPQCGKLLGEARQAAVPNRTQRVQENAASPGRRGSRHYQQPGAWRVLDAPTGGLWLSSGQLSEIYNWFAVFTAA